MIDDVESPRWGRRRAADELYVPIFDAPFTFRSVAMESVHEFSLSFEADVEHCFMLEAYPYFCATQYGALVVMCLRDGVVVPAPMLLMVAERPLVPFDSTVAPGKASLGIDIELSSMIGGGFAKGWVATGTPGTPPNLVFGGAFMESAGSQAWFHNLAFHLAAVVAARNDDPVGALKRVPVR